MNEKIVLVIPAPTDDGHIDAVQILRELLQACRRSSGQWPRTERASR